MQRSCGLLQPGWGAPSTAGKPDLGRITPRFLAFVKLNKTGAGDAEYFPTYINCARENFYILCSKNIHKKILKKVLTKGWGRGRIMESPRKSGNMVFENWTVRDEYKACKCERTSRNSEREYNSKKSKERAVKLEIDFILFAEVKILWFREFDPGSGLTLAACITHSSRTVRGLRPLISGGRVSNAWATCPCVRDTVWKQTLIPYDPIVWHHTVGKGLLHKDGLASD